MKIKSITLHDFMRYKGDNTLVFSTDPEKNVTVVLGGNTFGKTTLAQAFRWGLYESFNETNYTKKKDIVILNNEVIADMSMKSIREAWVEIIVEADGDEYKFVRKAKFNRKSEASNDISVKQLGNTQLTMQVKHDGVWGEIIDNNGNNKNDKIYKTGCVQETIDNMFPSNLSNYFFFDGERWNDLKSKTSDIKASVDTILGVSGLVEMKKHLKDGRTNAISLLRADIKGSDSEYTRVQASIKQLESDISDFEERIKQIDEGMETTQRTYDSTLKIINDNRKIEDDQKEYLRMEKDIERNMQFRDGYYADVVKEISNSAKFFAAGLLPELTEILDKIDLQGKDIPGVTIDTLEYLLNTGECLCGSKLSEGTDEYENIVKLKKLVPPEMIGGAAGKLQAVLETWKNESSDLLVNIREKADSYASASDVIYDLEDEKEKLAKTMDRKTNLGPVRAQNKQAKDRLESFRNEKSSLTIRMKNAKERIETLNSQLDAIAKHSAENKAIYRAIAYAEAMYEKADKLASGRQNTILSDLNQIIADNFKRMFNDHEKYAKLEDDYKVHVYYHQLGDKMNVEEETLSNGETIAINFVFIVSILELAKQYKNLEDDDEDYGMQNAILDLPLVLDAPFSALSNENTGLVANRLPEFAEQVIIFMLDKDWEASGLDKYTLPEYCYHVEKEATANSSRLERD